LVPVSKVHFVPTPPISPSRGGCRGLRKRFASGLRPAGDGLGLQSGKTWTVAKVEQVKDWFPLSELEHVPDGA
jgi:hypothetical protein